jgi:hypothetical protein
MAFVASEKVDSTRLRTAISNGPIRQQIMSFTCLSTDTSGTVTATNLNEIQSIIVPGLVLTAAATFAGNVATLAFNAPGGTTIAGDLIVMGI